MEAAKQCNRGIIPKVGIPLSFKEALDNAKGSSLALIPYEKETGIKLKEVLSSSSSVEKVSVFIGLKEALRKRKLKQLSLAVYVL